MTQDANEARRRLARAESEKAAAMERLRETSDALLEASQSLARIPVLEQRLEDCGADNAWLREEIAGLRTRVEELEGRGS